MRVNLRGTIRVEQHGQPWSCGKESIGAHLESNDERALNRAIRRSFVSRSMRLPLTRADGAHSSFYPQRFLLHSSYARTPPNTVIPCSFRHCQEKKNSYPLNAREYPYHRYGSATEPLVWRSFTNDRLSIQWSLGYLHITSPLHLLY